MNDDEIHQAAVRTALVPVSQQAQQDREARVKRDFWSTIKRAGRAIPFVDEVIAAYYCATDPATPAAARATLFGALAYFVMPFDLVPDMLALIGFGDDIAVLAAVIATMRNHITEDHRAKARAALADERDGPTAD